MKKIMLAVAIICSAICVQAATVTWKSAGALYNEAGSKVGRYNATLYAYVLSADNYAKLTDSAAIWATYGADVLAGGTTAAAKANSGMASAVSVNTESTGANAPQYVALIVTYGTGDDMVYYAEKATVTTGDDGKQTYGTFGAGAIDTAANAAKGWTSTTASGGGGESENIPEPTSGLLLLVGMGALALRRKRA